MKRSRYNEEQIIGILKEHQAGLSARDLCRKHGISDATFYKWRSKYGGLEVSDARRLKALEDENRKLKKLLAESLLDAATLKEMLGKNVWSAPSVQDSSSFRRSSLHKCIRPLASELLLQLGHDEIRAHRSRILASGCKARFFAQSLRYADRLFRHHSPEPRSLSNGRQAVVG